MKKISEIKPITVTLSSSEVLKELKDTSYWSALKELMVGYIQQQKDIAWQLDEKDDKFVIRHSQLTSAANAFNFLIKYIEKDVRRKSQDE